jgi:hypothetical protein
MHRVVTLIRGVQLSALWMIAVVVMSVGCSGGGSGTVAADVPAALDIDAFTADAAADAAPDGLEAPVPDPVAAARAFTLYYRERVERAVVAYNRFMLFGDIAFAINIRKAGIARTGDTFEVVPGPNDNNSIGTSARAAWFAYKVFRTRLLALSCIRMFDGLAWLATMTGHDGVTGRNAYPGWTLSIDGATGTVTRTREGAAVAPPVAPDEALQAEMLSAFFDGIHVTYRGEPQDILLAYMPVQEIGPYAVTYGFSMLPRFLRVSDCCTSLMRVPAPYPWAGGFFSNHNSRDNFPDLAFGFLAAREAMDDPDADPDVRAAAGRAWAAGQLVGDSVQANGGRIMTVGEEGPWEQLIPSGQVRPDGTTEAEDLGSMSDCQMTYLARALSTQGLALPLPELPEPGALDRLFAPILDKDVGCAPEGATYTCTSLAGALCGKDWGQMNELTLGHKGLIDKALQMEATVPGSANAILGHFYGNYDQPVNSLLGVVEYARVTGNAELLAAARAALKQMTDLSRVFADVLYASTNPGEQARKRYWTALIDAQGGLPASTADLGELAEAEQQMARLEGVLDMGDTGPAALLSDEQIAARVQDELSGESDVVKQRYADAWGTTPPLRRTADGYEARTSTPEGVTDWHAVPTPRHVVYGGLELLEALPLCVSAPGALDCTWARLGCARPDLDHDGTVGEADRARFEQSRAAATTGCGAANDWCGGADLDRTGTVDALDEAFLAAADGCRYEAAVR